MRTAWLLCDMRPRGRNNRGTVLIELVAAVLLMFGIFIGTAVIGVKTMDFDSDIRGSGSAADLVFVLDDETGAPVQADFDVIGQKIMEISRIRSDEEFQMYFTLVHNDHRGPGVSIDWQGSYGVSAALVSRIDFGPGFVSVNGYDLTVADDERVVVVEVYRSRRGLFVDNSAPVYNFALSWKFDPDQL